MLMLVWRHLFFFTAGRAEEELFVVVSAKYQELQYDR